MSDIGNLSTHLANTNTTQAKSSVRPEPPPPLTVQNAVAQTLNSPQAAVNQSPNAGHAEWRREATSDGKRQHTHEQEEDTPAPTRERLNMLLEQLNQRLRHCNTHLQFEAIGGNVDWRIRIIDQDTRDLVRWISWEETLAFARSLEEFEVRQSHGALCGYASGLEDMHLGMEGGLLRVTT
ncbi:MAG: flagellar protein FlaG [Gammaproteobacteria bacterium]|nr:flagellar protein FlaG [Gammaproteobacteria bacterium]